MNRDALFAAMEMTASPRPLPVDVPGWGRIFVKPPTAGEIDEHAAEQAKYADDTQHRFARAAARLICDENGNRLFDPGNASDVALLAKQPWSLLSKVLNAADAEDTTA